MRAASSGQLAIVQYLAEKGANLDMQDEYGYTSLIKAAERGYLPIVQYLTEKGANKDIQDNVSFDRFIAVILSILFI